MLRAESLEKLRSLLAQMDMTVPADPKQRSTALLERYAAARLLSTLPSARLGFPLSLTHRNPPDDRPDFLLDMGTRSIGIEHTRAIPQNEAHELTLRRAGNGPDTHFIQRAQPGEPRKSRQQLIEEIKADDPGDGWAGDSPDREWAAAMFAFVSAKVVSSRKEGFQRFPENWLLIYDEWPLPDFNPEHAADILLV